MPFGALVDAIRDDRLVPVAGALLDDPRTPEDERDVARRALATCTRIGERVATELDAVLTVLAGGGLHPRPVGAAGPHQRHEIVLRVTSTDEAARAAELLEQAGYRRWGTWTGGAAASFWHAADEVALARTGTATMVVHIRWREPRRRSHLARLFRPTPADWSMVALPRRAWPLYHVVRPVRLVGERLGLRPRDHTGRGPFLATPDDLLEPLLDLAGVGPGDVVLDFGCGDGRLPVAAAGRGCRAIGVEADAAIAEQARRRVADAGVDDLVRIDHGDAWAADLSGVTALFLFLPVGLLGRVVDHALPRLASGARIVAHEQSPVPSPPRRAPDATFPVVAEEAVTVASLWTAP
jgi:SAM-dependent methyltransferase